MQAATKASTLNSETSITSTDACNWVSTYRDEYNTVKSMNATVYTQMGQDDKVKTKELSTKQHGE